MLNDLKKTRILFFLLMLVLSCRKEEPAPKEPENKPCDFTNIIKGWEIVSVSLPKVPTQNDLYFPSAQTGYTVGNYGSILKSLDGGKIWEVIHHGMNNQALTRLRLLAVHFIDDKTGYVAGERETFGFGDELGKGSILLSTRNGGTTWRKQYYQDVSKIYDLVFFNQEEGIGIFYVDNAATGKRDLKMVSTADSGNNWKNIDLPANTKMSSYEFFQTDSKIMVFAKSTDGKPIILVSADQGKKWEVLHAPADYGKKLYFFDDKSGYMTCSPGKIFFTLDGGNSWKEIPAPRVNSSAFIHFNSLKEGFIINPIYDYVEGGGEVNAITRSFEVSQTSNAGNNWTIPVVLPKECDITGRSQTILDNVVYSMDSRINKFEKR